MAYRRGHASLSPKPDPGATDGGRTATPGRVVVYETGAGDGLVRRRRSPGRAVSIWIRVCYLDRLLFDAWGPSGQGVMVDGSRMEYEAT